MLEFEWDDEKDRANQKKHRVSFLEAVDSFFDPNGFKLIDHSHGANEDRYYWVGRSKGGRVLTTYFTQRGDKIRIIGCAEWRKFRRIYDEAAKNKEP